MEAGGGCRLVDEYKESLRESPSHAPCHDHDKAWPEHIWPSEERGRVLLRGKTQGRGSLAAVGIGTPCSSQAGAEFRPPRGLRARRKIPCSPNAPHDTSTNTIHVQHGNGASIHQRFRVGTYEIQISKKISPNR